MSNFTVYPDTATATLLGKPADQPITLTNGVATTAFAPLSPFAGPDPTAGGLSTSFVRIAMSGSSSSAAPMVEVVAVNSGTATQGSPVTVSATSLGGSDQLLDGTNPTEAAGAYFAPASFANNVYLLKLVIFITGTTFKIRLTNSVPDPTGSRGFVWVVADSDALSQQSWIDMSTTIVTPSPFETLINEPALFSLAVFNYGTGSLGNIVAMPAGADAGNFSVTAIPAGTFVNPNDQVNVMVNMAAITSPKKISATLNFSSNDPHAPLTTAKHNSQVAIAATVSKLELGFLLDASGSMALAPNGTSIIAVNRNATRWGLLKSAAQGALAALGNHAVNKGRFGVGMYPNITPFPADPTAAYSGPFPVPSPTSADLFALSDITAANLATAASAMDSHFTRENGAATPMGAGIVHAIGKPDGSVPWGYFSSTANDVSLNRRWLILMTDGNQNSGEDPSEFYGAAGGFQPKNIRVAALGYGNDSAPVEPVNKTLLNTIVSNGATGSAAHFVTAAEDPSLTTAFIKTTLLTGLQFDTVTDPDGVLLSGRTVKVPVLVSEFDQKISFIVAWTKFDEQRLRVQVQTPLGELIEAAGSTFTVNFNPRFRMLTFGGDFLSPRTGTWYLIITLAESKAAGGPVVKAVAVDSEKYSYQVIVQSRLRLRAQTDQPFYAAGDRIRITAMPSLDWQGIPDASVTLSRTLPGNAFPNFLAHCAVTPQLFDKTAQSQIPNPDIDSLGIKQLALASAGVSFTPVINTDVIAMTDPGRKGIYTADTDTAGVPGNYQFLVTAVGSLPDGTVFKRQTPLTVNVAVRPNSSCSVFHVVYSTFILNEHLVTRAVMTIRPLDCFGNAVMIDPRFDPSLGFTATAGTFEGAIVDNHDGSYTRTLVYAGDQLPSVSVTLGGIAVVPKTPVVNIQKLTFIDKIYHFSAGQEAAPGANQHRDPAVCLGDSTKKTNPGFVSLGGGGSLIAGFSDRFVEGKGGQDDVTIFVHPDEEARPYAVDVLTGPELPEWIEIGRSAGNTQSFGLVHNGRILRGRLLRIRDLSHRIRNDDGSASSTPGVSILAVGAEHVQRCILDLDGLIVLLLQKLLNIHL